MHWQLSPLQSRLAASVIATILLIILYLSLFNPQFALADEINHGSPIVFDDPIPVDTEDRELEMREAIYEPEFQAFDRSILGRAATTDATGLTNNVPVAMNIDAGTSYIFIFDSTQLSSSEDALLELRGESGTLEEETRAGGTRMWKRANSTVYISANTCLQPSSNATTSSPPPQLTLYVSNSTDNTAPGPSADATTQDAVPFTEGAVMYNLTTSSETYVAVGAANMSSEFSGIYNVQIAASVDGWYHTYNETSADVDLFWVDSDTTSVLLMTSNLTTTRDRAVEQQFMTLRPYSMFAQNNDNPSIDGLRYSYCGLNFNAQIAAVRNGQATTQVTTDMTKRGTGGHPKQQFYFSGLNSSAKYTGILARNVDNSSNLNVVGGGGSVLSTTHFETKSAYGNCQLVFNLTFCDQVAYAVPGNTATFPDQASLGQFYDDYALSLYDGFNKSMQLIPCDADNTQQYSLVRNCTTCHGAYRNWLCSVTIPRCEDFSQTGKFLQPRAINTTFPDGSTPTADELAGYAHFKDQLSYQMSRNPQINSIVKPGPYKEVLPCEELCYELVQNCPAAMGFTCPRPWNIGFNTSYGTMQGTNGSTITCNYPGNFHVYSAASALANAWLLSAVVVLMTTVAVLW
ncbi:unnamed protein product [Discula destructiva]